MRLSYRGSLYQTDTSAIETTATEVTAKYRGIAYSIRHEVSRTDASPETVLKFRGVVYSKV